MDNRIADANKKVQPAPAELEGEATSEGCAKLVPAPLPGEVENLIWTFRCDLRRAIPGDVSEMLLTLVNADDLHKAINLISDLTRRLAEAEAERDEHRDNATMLQGRCASALAQLATRERECLATMEQLIGERAMLRGNVKAAEARVRELEATIDAMAEAHAHDDMALTAAYLSGAHEGKKQAEAFKTRVMEWAQGRCECCESWESDKMCLTCIRCTCLGTMVSTKEADNWTPPQEWKVGD